MNYLVISKINYEIRTLEQKSQNSDLKKIKLVFEAFAPQFQQLELLLM